MSTFLPAEKGQTIREPSTANFLIDSTDRDDKYPTAGDFQIISNQSLLNGFFTRLAPVEVVLDWCVDNISVSTENTTFSVNVGGTDYVATLADGQYNVQQALDALVVALNGAGTGITFSVGGTAGASGQKTLTATGNFVINDTQLARELNLAIGSAAGVDYPVNCPLLLPYTYLDFVSQQLTYNQDLKDTTTNYIKRDVLYRWYFAWDGPAPLDTYGYPINQGYQRFVQRRYIPFPKQIRWDNIQPIGNLGFQVFSSQGTPLDPAASAGEFEWKMTMLVSEC